MDDWKNLGRMLDELAASGKAEVHEDGEWLAELAGLHCEFRRQGKQALLHLWSEERNLVRRVLRVAELDPAHVVLEVQRFGRAKPARLEISRADRPRTPARLSRERFRARFGRLVAQQFPDAELESLTAAPDLERSLSGLYARGLLKEGSLSWTVLGVSSTEDSSTIEGILTFGLVWLDAARRLSVKRSIVGLRLFVPESAGRLVRHRVQALGSSAAVEIYEFSEATWQVRRIESSDTGNLESWLVPRREVEARQTAAQGAFNRIRALVPGTAEAMDSVIPPGTSEAILRFRGLAFANWKDGQTYYGVGDDSHELTGTAWPELEKLVRLLDLHRSPLAEDTNNGMYRAAPERWLETLVLADPTRLSAHLDPRSVYSQVPALSAGERGVIDLLGVTRAGRLVVIELKASEDIHLPLQAVDYWLRVCRHQREGDFQRYGYFTEVILEDKPPLLWLVSPGLRFHPTTDLILKYLTSAIEVTRIGLNENWRRGLQVVFRM